MNALNLQVNAGNLPTGFCPATLQEMLVGFSAVQSVTFPSTFAGVTVSSSKPTDQTQAWLQLDSLGRPTRLYWFAQGAWLSLHPCVPGFTMIWTGALPDFTTFDGGDANALSQISGPMWEEVVSLRVRFPLGAGTLPSGTVINSGDIGGEENHTLSLNEIPSHTHAIPNFGGPVGATAVIVGDNATPIAQPDISTRATGGNPDGTTAGHQNMPPYLGVYFLRRTSKLYYSVT